MKQFSELLGLNRTVFWGLTRWQLGVMLGVAAYVGLAFLVFGVAFRYLCVGAILIGLAASGRAQAGRFLRDWFPLLLFWIGYDALRGFADEILPRVAMTFPYQLETALFGWLAEGQVLACISLAVLEGSLWRTPLFATADVFYWSHFVIVPSYMLYLWWQPPTSARFRRLVYGLTVLHLITLATYFLYPAAPPWYVFYFGFDQPSSAFLKNPAIFNTPVLFKTLWAANPNWFAAIPSLHGAYPVLLFLLIAPSGRARRWVAYYGVCIWLATIVRGHHYIIDLILGALYALPSAWLAKRWVKEPCASPKSWPTTPTRWTALKNDAANEKKEALPPRTRSARPKGVSTVS